MWLFMWPLAMLNRMCPPPAPRSFAAIERQVDRVGHEVGVEQQAALLARVGEVVRLAVEAILEVVARVEDEVEVAERVDDHRRVGHGDVARGLAAGAVEVLVPGVQRDREDRARLPLERDPRARRRSTRRSSPARRGRRSSPRRAGAAARAPCPAGSRRRSSRSTCARHRGSGTRRARRAAPTA